MINDRKKVGIYIHYPFCRQKCLYCDFYSQTSDSMRDEYHSALIWDIKNSERERIDSIYIGGGTPSLMSEKEIYEIISALNESFDIEKDCEITLEANPGIDLPKNLSELGINRLSIGAQSFVDDELVALGRIHKSEDIAKTAELSAINNISLDLMFGIPLQTLESFEYSLNRAVSIAEHISVYGLTVEENTPFYKMKDSLKLPDEDAEAAMYFKACDFLKSRGYEHYEISNFTKNKRCRHNMRYWQCEEYIGFGPAAHSYYRGRRFGNTRDIHDYIKRIKTGLKPLLSEDIVVDPQTEDFEYLMLSCRTFDGIDFSRFKNKKKDILIKLEKYVKNGYIEMTQRGFRLTEKGFYISNSIITDLSGAVENNH